MIPMRALRFMTYSLIMSIATVVCHAVPVRRDTVTVIQSDGKRLKLTYLGDEFGTFYVNPEGEVMEKGQNGIWHKTLVLDRPAPLRLLTSTGPGSYKIQNFPVTGSPRCLVVLVDFTDRKFSADNETIVRMIDDRFNKKGYTDTITYKGDTFQGASGSVRDYFESQSYGLLTPKFDVIGPIHASHGYAYYGKNNNNSSGNDTENAIKLVKEVCDSIVANSLADMLTYDNNYDGEVDLLAVIFAGRGENYYGSDPNTIWPHQYGMRMVGIDGLTKINYLLTCELFWDSNDIIDGIGTFCHEFSHILGLPDFYDTVSGNTDCLGSWSIMDYGLYGNLGFSPSGYTAFERYSLGWMEIPEANTVGKYFIESLDDKADAYRLNTDDEDKFIILENHQQKGWFRYQKGSGLLVTTVSYNKTKWLWNKVNVSSRNYAVIPADNKSGKDNETGDLFPYYSKDSITMFSTPELKVYDGNYITYPITGIRNSGGVVSFTLGRSGTVDGIHPPMADNDKGLIHVFDLSGKPVGSFSSDIPVEQLPLSSGIWLIRKDGKTKKVRF